VVIAGTSKSGLHNKPAGCGAAEAYVSGPGSEEDGNPQNDCRENFKLISILVALSCQYPYGAIFKS
jgi:hypothetical protein